MANNSTAETNFHYRVSAAGEFSQHKLLPDSKFWLKISTLQATFHQIVITGGNIFAKYSA